MTYSFDKLARLVTLLGLVLVVQPWASGAVAAKPLHEYCEFGSSTAVFLIDVTTRIDGEDRDNIWENGFLDFYDRDLQSGDMFFVHTIDDQDGLTEAIGWGCRAQCPDDPLTRCVGGRGGDEADEHRQLQELRLRFIHLLNQSKELPRSHIVDAITEVTGRYGAKSDIHPLRKIVVQSDMLENSTTISTWDFRMLPVEKVVRRFEENDLIPSLQDVSVAFYGCGRNHITGRPLFTPTEMGEIKERWNTTFVKGGAQPGSIEWRCPDPMN